MNTKNRNKFFLLGVFLFLAASSVGYYFYNKGPIDVKNASAITIEATTLYNAFESDSLSAQKKYSGKVLEVTGELKEISSNQKNERVLLLSSGVEGAYINCTLEQESLTEIIPGKNITVKAICNGIGQAEPELGIKADLYLNRGYLK